MPALHRMDTVHSTCSFSKAHLWKMVNASSQGCPLSSFFSEFPHLMNFKANNYKGCHIKSYIPPERKPISIGVLHWSRPPMRAFRVTDTNILVSKKPQIPIVNLKIQLSPCVGHNAALCPRYAQHEPQNEQVENGSVGFALGSRCACRFDVVCLFLVCVRYIQSKRGFRWNMCFTIIRENDIFSSCFTVDSGNTLCLDYTICIPVAAGGCSIYTLTPLSSGL